MGRRTIVQLLGLVTAAVLTVATAACGDGDTGAVVEVDDTSSRDGADSTNTSDDGPRDLDLSGGLSTTSVAVGEASTLREVAVSPLGAGTYVPALFDPSVSFTVGDGWHLVNQDAAGFWISQSVTSAFEATKTQGLEVTDLSQLEVLEPPYPPSVMTEKSLEYDRLPVPDDVAVWLAGSEWLEAGPIETVQIDGIEADTFQGRVMDLPDDLFEDALGVARVHRFGFANGYFYVFEEGGIGRIWIVAGDGRQLIVEAYTPEGPDATEFLATAAAVVESMTFG